MKPVATTVAIACIASTALTAPTVWSGSGPANVVRRSDAWHEGRAITSLNQAQVQQIGKDIKGNLTATIDLITKVSEEEPEVNPPFQDTIKTLKTIVQSIGGALMALANLKGSSDSG